MDPRPCPAETSPDFHAGSPLLAAHPLAILRPDSLVQARSLDACFLHLSTRQTVATALAMLAARNRMRG
jgi:hypothetical protein